MSRSHLVGSMLRRSVFAFAVIAAGSFITATRVSGSSQCMMDWLQLAGLSQEEAQSAGMEQRLVLSQLSEKTVEQYAVFTLQIVLRIPEQVAESLKKCVARDPQCGAPLTESRLPCSAGTCQFRRGLNSSICNCPAGWEGDRCNQDADECLSRTPPCGPPGKCVNTNGSYDCQCPAGFLAFKSRCLDIDECAVGRHDCHANAACTNTQGLYTCECNDGYHGDGVSCSDDQCAVSTAPDLCRMVQTMSEQNAELQRQLQDLQGETKVQIATLQQENQRLSSQLLQQKKDIRSLSSETHSSTEAVKKAAAAERRRIDGALGSVNSQMRRFSLSLESQRAIQQQATTVERIESDIRSLSVETRSSIEAVKKAAVAERRRIDGALGSVSSQIGRVSASLQTAESRLTSSGRALDGKIAQVKSTVRPLLGRIKVAEGKIRQFLACFGRLNQYTAGVTAGCRLPLPQVQIRERGGP